ncbi:MAG: DUF692 family protein [Deltaproteobacteria bacterium]|nr:DUF692 family protein [Deltaproteobacteria bacterium]
MTAAGFSTRARRLPTLGVGISTEYGASQSGALHPLDLHARHPGVVEFLELGVETVKGLDADGQAWADAGLPTTYHFLDVNLDEPDDLDEDWLEEVRALLQRARPAWLCGDAGLWHLGARERGHMLLLPPILSHDGVAPMADGIRALRAATGLEVFPENPPGRVFLGDLHVLDFFGRVVDAADTGLLLDCAHLAIFQRLRGLPPLAGLDGFPLDRVVEMHVAGGTPMEHDGFRWVEDDHGPEPLADTWMIFDHVVARAPNLRAVVFECERNTADEILPGFHRLHAALAGRGTRR